MKNSADYLTVDLGITQEYPMETQTVEVTVNASTLIPDYANGIIEEMYRINYFKAKQVNLTVDELVKYLEYLLIKRIQCVHNVCRDFRQLKVLWIPCYFQFALSQIGIAIDREQGFKFVPYFDGIDDVEHADLAAFSEMLTISDKLSAFSNESNLPMVQDAMPRDVHGDLNFMSSALIGEVIRALRALPHPTIAYITTLLDMKLKEEATYGILYRRKYGDKNLVAQVIVNEKRLI